MSLEISFRAAVTNDLSRCREIRGLTNDNPIPADVLEAIGVTDENWQPKLDSGEYTGVVAEYQGMVVAYCFGDTLSAEILVLAVLKGFEGMAIGKRLLQQTSEKLFSKGHKKLWLAASPLPTVRAHGFYRRLGWIPSGQIDDNGDEILHFSQ